jgi:hypothetical protein
MKKIILAAIIILTARTISLAQPLATDTRVQFQKGDKAAAVIELPYNPDIVAASIRDNMLKKGIKEEKIKGFQAFKGARLAPTDGEVVDLYFKVDRKSRKDNISVVYLIIGRPNENVALRTGDDSFKVSEAKTYLNTITPSVEGYNLEVGIQQQDEVIKKAEKRLRNLEDDQKDYERKLRSMEEKVGQNKRDLEAQNAEVTKQRSVRDAMQARRVVPAMTN